MVTCEHHLQSNGIDNHQTNTIQLGQSQHIIWVELYNIF
jgi:hypothetical protein